MVRQYSFQDVELQDRQILQVAETSTQGLEKLDLETSIRLPRLSQELTFS